VRQLLPEPVDDLDLGAAYETDRRPAQPGRPWLVLNMVVSIDGATAVQGRSAGLGGAADRIAFGALRSTADVILVGAGTVRAEHYGPPRTSAEHRARRRARGQEAFPRLAVVSGRLDLDLAAPLFTESPNRPIVITAAVDGDRPPALVAVDEVADVIAVGDGHADLEAALGELARQGVGVVLCEGGPMLNDQLLSAGLVDEACVTVAPLLAGGSSKRMISGPSPEMTRSMRLDRLVEDQGSLLLRYVRAD
jgi:riboflavin-specific deaminase-like protein